MKGLKIKYSILPKKVEQQEPKFITFVNILQFWGKGFNKEQYQKVLNAKKELL